jgi:putative PIN family toxin of toxin-antitoxin system
MRVVLDSVIIVRALINPNGIWGRVVFDHHSQYHLVTSRPLLTEMLEVVLRPEITKKYRPVAKRDLAFIMELFSFAELVMFDDIPAISRDPDDDHVLETARMGKADYLVTQDNDLLDIKSHAGCRILTAYDFVAILTDNS